MLSRFFNWWKRKHLNILKRRKWTCNTFKINAPKCRNMMTLIVNISQFGVCKKNRKETCYKSDSMRLLFVRSLRIITRYFRIFISAFLYNKVTNMAKIRKSISRICERTRFCFWKTLEFSLAIAKKAFGEKKLSVRNVSYSWKLRVGENFAILPNYTTHPLRLAINYTLHEITFAVS